jgi:arylsulfatase
MRRQSNELKDTTYELFFGALSILSIINLLLFIDGEEAGQGRVEHTVGIIFASDETVNVGLDAGTAVSDAYDPQDNSFSRRINWVELDVDEAAVDQDHYISPEERMNVVLSRQ